MSSARIKICGITNIADAKHAIELGVDYLGFIFADSPRKLNVAQAAEIANAIPAQIGKVGVFVDEDRRVVTSAIRSAGLDIVQLHGQESPNYCSQIGIPVIKVFRTHSPDRDIFEHISKYDTEFYLLEPFVPGLAGGTGKTADWPLAARIISHFPDRKFFLAGGLSPQNVVPAIRGVRPFAVDASSGVEDSPGVKNSGKMKSFIKAVRAL